MGPVGKDPPKSFTREFSPETRCSQSLCKLMKAGVGVRLATEAILPPGGNNENMLNSYMAGHQLGFADLCAGAERG
jgi:hypothetical protein